MIKDQGTSLSKGCAFVKFASMTEAESAIAKLKHHHAPDVEALHQEFVLIMFLEPASSAAEVG